MNVLISPTQQTPHLADFINLESRDHLFHICTYLPRLASLVKICPAQDTDVSPEETTATMSEYDAIAVADRMSKLSVTNPTFSGLALELRQLIYDFAIFEESKDPHYEYSTADASPFVALLQVNSTIRSELARTRFTNRNVVFRSPEEIHVLAKCAGPESLASITHATLQLPDKLPLSITEDDIRSATLLLKVANLTIGIYSSHQPFAQFSQTLRPAMYVKEILLVPSCPLNLESVRIRDLGLEQQIEELQSAPKKNTPWPYRKAALDRSATSLCLENRRLAELLEGNRMDKEMRLDMLFAEAEPIASTNRLVKLADGGKQARSEQALRRLEGVRLDQHSTDRTRYLSSETVAEATHLVLDLSSKYPKELTEKYIRTLILPLEVTHLDIRIHTPEPTEERYSSDPTWALGKALEATLLSSTTPFSIAEICIRDLGLEEERVMLEKYLRDELQGQQNSKYNLHTARLGHQEEDLEIVNQNLVIAIGRRAAVMWEEAQKRGELTGPDATCKYWERVV